MSVLDGQPASRRDAQSVAGGQANAGGIAATTGTRPPKINRVPAGRAEKNGDTPSPFFLRVPSGREFFLRTDSGGGGDASGVRLTTGYILGIPPGCLQDDPGNRSHAPRMTFGLEVPV